MGEEGSSRGARNSCGTTKTRRITKLATNGPRSDSDAADQHGHRRWRDHGSPGGLATWDAADPLGALCMHIRSIKNIVGEWTDGSSFCLRPTYELAWYPATKCAQTSFNSVDSTATWFSCESNVTFHTFCHFSDPNTSQATFILLTVTPLLLHILIMTKPKESEKNKGAHSKLTKPPPSCSSSNLDLATDEPKTVRKGIDYIVEDAKYPKGQKERVVTQILRAFALSKIKHSAKKRPWPKGEIKRNQESDFKVNTKLDRAFRKTETLNRKATRESSFELVEKEEEMEKPKLVAKVAEGTLH